MSTCKVHNVRFYNPKPEAIYCMALQKRRRKLAVSRADGSIEIWNLTHMPFIERTIVSTSENYSIEGLVWCDNRLFSVGLDGFLIEYNLLELTKKRVVSVTGEAAYCLDINSSNTKIAVGTEQGYLNIFNIEEDDILFDKFLDKQEGRILCLKFDASSKFIASGSVDAVRIWNVVTGQALFKMTTGRSEANKLTIIWCIHILEDLTVITGDSRGKLTFWDGKIGAQIESYQTHKSDVLTLCVSDDEKSLYCAGVDPNIMNYAKVNVKGGNHKWVKSVQRKVHDHDVRSLILCEDKLYSSGMDGYLACSYYPPKTLIKHPPILQNPCVTLCSAARFILLRYTRYLEVWSLGRSLDTENNKGLLALDSEPKCLLTLHRTVKSDSGAEVKEGIICCSMSSNGRWIVYSTDSTLRIFHFNYKEESIPELVPVDNMPSECSVSVQAVFTPDSSKLILAPRSGGLQVYDLTAGTPILIQNISTNLLIKDTITFLACSPCSQFLIIANPQSHIIVWKCFNDEWTLHCKLPKYSSPPTALAVKPNSKSLVVIYADHRIVEFGLKSKSFTKFSRSLEQRNSNSWPNKFYAVKNVVFDPRSENVTILHDDANIVVIDRNKPLPESDAKIPKIESTSLSDSSESFKSAKHAFHAIKKYKHLVHLGWLSDDEMVAVEVSPTSILEQLPPCLKQNTFGTK